MTPEYKEAVLRSALYELLSIAFLYPRQETPIALLDGARSLLRESSQVRWGVVRGNLDDLARKLDGADYSELEREYEEVFGHTTSTDCPPYEAEYGQAQVFQKSQTLADLSAFYNSFGVEPNPDLKDRLDHISVEMEFMHLLTLKEAHALLNGHGEGKVLICRRGQEAFLADHLAGWIRDFDRRLAGKAPGWGIYSLVAPLLRAFMDAELEKFHIHPEATPSVHGDSTLDNDLECDGCQLAVEAVEEVRER